MGDLDFLKTDWKKQDEDIPQLSYDDIYKMLWKRSSSIVRWIFTISICELFVSSLLNIFLSDDDFWKNMQQLHLKDFTIGLLIFSYSVTIFFIYRFYKNYRTISSTDNTKNLMKNILKTRKTVKTYIAYVLISTGVTMLIVTYFTVKNHVLNSSAPELSKYHYETMDWVKFSTLFVLITLIFLALLWLFYRLIYGILLKKLLQNYKELQKLEL